MAKDAFPPMHTAEHILNQSMVRLFGTGRCFSAHIEKKKSKCDYKFDRNLTPDESSKLEDKVNEVVKDNLSVSEEFISRKEAENKYNLGRLPEGAGESIRIIKIGDYDACPCSGSHVKSTKEIGHFKIVSSDNENGVLRIRFKLILPT